MDRGTYLEMDGRPAVRFERTYPHPVDRVWAAVSEPEGLRHWFPSRVSYEPRAGGEISFSEDPRIDPHREPTTGRVLVFEPPHRDGAELWRPLYEAYVADGVPSGAHIPGS
jgi:uncharacterized protein YndB with AHSA1/START domain